jgi:hypothetical protein
MNGNVACVEFGEPNRELLLQAYNREYDTLREELLLTIKSRNQILSFAIGALGIGLGAGAASELNRRYEYWALFVLLPILIAAIYALWCSEFLRMVRASQRLSMLEGAINRLIMDRDPLGKIPQGMSWETFLRPPKGATRPNAERCPTVAHHDVCPSAVRQPLRRVVKNSIMGHLCVRKERAQNFPERAIAYLVRHDQPGCWRGNAQVDLHQPLTAFMLMLVLGLGAVGAFVHGVPDPPAGMLRALAFSGLVLCALQAWLFAREKYRFARPLKVDTMQVLVRQSRAAFDDISDLDAASLTVSAAAPASVVPGSVDP